MTENEAKTKWCPFARYVSHAGEGINRWVSAEDTNLSPDPAKCIASACMAWRATYENRGMHGSHVKSGGFCGLAGAPQ